MHELNQLRHKMDSVANEVPFSFPKSAGFDFALYTSETIVDGLGYIIVVAFPSVTDKHLLQDVAGCAWLAICQRW